MAKKKKKIRIISNHEVHDMRNSLFNCPYCGDFPGMIDRRQRRKDKRYSLCCLNINCPVQPKTKGAPTIGEAMEKWQQRRAYKDETERQPIGYRR